MENRFKYRGYDKDTKRWYYGAYLQQSEYADSPFEKADTKPSSKKHLIVFEEIVDWGLPTKIKVATVDKESIGQCTGLKDKNGNLIYEGDIVKVSGYGVEGIFEIFWDDITAQFAISIYESDCFEHSQSVMEILGNIHKNKDLLVRII